MTRPIRILGIDPGLRRPGWGVGESAARRHGLLGCAPGVAMGVPARAGVPVSEYAPNVVKKSIVGSGHGDKVQVRMMIGVLLPKSDPATHDAAAPLAIAVTQ